MEERIDKPKIFPKEEEENGENENSEAPPSIIQSTLDNQSQYSRDNQVQSINFSTSELNIIPSVNEEIKNKNKEINNQNNQEQLPQLNDYIKTPYFPENENNSKNYQNQNNNNQIDQNQNNLNSINQNNNENNNNYKGNPYNNQNPYKNNNINYGPNSQFWKMGFFGPHGNFGFKNNYYNLGYYQENNIGNPYLHEYPYGPHGTPPQQFLPPPHGPNYSNNPQDKNVLNPENKEDNNEKYKNLPHFWHISHGPHFWGHHGPHFWEYPHDPHFWNYPHGPHFHFEPHFHHGPPEPHGPHFIHGPHEHGPHHHEHGPHHYEHGPHHHEHWPHHHRHHGPHGEDYSHENLPKDNPEKKKEEDIK